MKLSLQDSISSRQDLRAVILEIQKCAGWLSQSTVKARVSGDNSHEAPTISRAADGLIKQWHADKPVSQKTLDELIAALKDFDTAAPSVVITLAAPPSNSLKKTLVAWCREHINPDMLVDFNFNSTMLGGMVVRYDSHIYDWSFRRQILAARGKFTEVLRHV